MAIDDGEDRGSSVHARRTAERVQNVLGEIAQTRAEFQSGRTVGDTSFEVHYNFQMAVVNAHDTLRPFLADEDEWRRRDILDEYALADIPNLIGTETVQKEVEKGLRRYTTEEVERPRLIPGGALLEMSYRLERMAEDIGFEPVPDQSAQEDTEFGYTDILGN